MWLYRHHTASDIIDLDHDTGRWRPVADSEKPAGAKVLADLPVVGSYEIEDGKHFYKYWTADSRFVFRSFDDRVFEICQERRDGSIFMQDPGQRCTIEPARYGDGRLRQGLSEVKLISGSGKLLYQLDYNADYYRRLHDSDITAAGSVRDLSDWDFFIALQAAFPYFRERAESGLVELTIDNDNVATIQGARIARDDLLYAESGQTCPRTGVWAAVSDLRHSSEFSQGDRLPQHQGHDIEWVWSRVR